MIYSATVLAQGRGHVVITSEFDWDTAMDKHGFITRRVERTGKLNVRRLNTRNELIEETTIERVDGEAVRDCKARAIAAVRMLGYWPELRRSLKEERELYGLPVKTSPLVPPGEIATIERLTDSGLILPPGHTGHKMPRKPGPDVISPDGGRIVEREDGSHDHIDPTR